MDKVKSVVVNQRRSQAWRDNLNKSFQDLADWLVYKTQGSMNYPSDILHELEQRVRAIREETENAGFHAVVEAVDNLAQLKKELAKLGVKISHNNTSGHPWTMEEGWECLFLVADSEEGMNEAIELAEQLKWKVWVKDNTGKINAYLYKPENVTTDWDDQPYTRCEITG